MLVAAAKTAASGWVRRNAPATTGYAGAFLTGSVLELGDSDVLPPTSDVDVLVVVDDLALPAKVGKLRVDGALIEVSFISATQLADPREVAALHYLAPSFTGGHLIDDPTGHLHELERTIAPGFPAPQQVRTRCASVVRRMVTGLDAVDPASPWHEQVTAWMFPASLPTHVVLVAALRNPTVRLRFLAAREVLALHGEATFYRQLLHAFGCAEADENAVRFHLEKLTAVFDEAAALGNTDFFFSADITPEARPVAIDGARDLIAAGDHAEAIFWIVATYSRCVSVMVDSTPQRRRSAESGFADAVTELLGLATPVDLAARTGQIRALLPTLDVVATRLIDSRPATA